MEKAQVLIVEDDGIIAMDIESQLKKLGYGVTGIVGYGEEALAKVKENKPDLVLMDIVLKGEIDGIEAAAEIRTQYDIPVIFLTAFVDKDRLERAKLTYPFGFILKPFQNKDLSVTIEMALYIAKADAERKQAEELLQTEKDKLEIITQNIGAGLCIISKDYRTLWANKVLKQIFGEVEGKVCYETYNQQTDVCLNCGVREIFETGKDKVIHEKVGKDADGQTICSEIIASPIRNKEGDIVSVLELVVPITERKLAEDALRESEVRFKSTAEMLQAAIVEHDLNGIVTYANSHALEMTGYSLEDIKEGLSVMQAIAPEDHEKRYRRLQKAIQGEILQPEEYRLLHKSGSIVWGLVSFEIIRQDGDAVGVRTSVIDITRRKQAEEALRKRTKDLELKTKSLEELNTAMKVLLKKREEDKTELEENVMTNVKELIEPYFDKINKTTLDDHQKAFLNILESNLSEIISPFTRKLSLKYLRLTPQEIKIVNMIKIGYTTKKIARIMKISPRTVDTHRKNIRSKIGLGKKKGSLRSHLLAYEQ